MLALYDSCKALAPSSEPPLLFGPASISPTERRAGSIAEAQLSELCLTIGNTAD